MGSGKTTLGTAVSRRAGIPFIDLDHYIEQCQGMSVRDIFSINGEDGFRQLEREALTELAGRENLLVACGGGTPCFYDNMSLMNASGTTVFLETPAETLRRRLSAGRDTRPLIAAMDDGALLGFINETMERRMPYYGMATATFNTGGLDDEAGIGHAADLFINRFIKNGD